MFLPMMMVQFLNEEVVYMEQRSKDVGLAISAASNVTDLGKAFPGQPSVAHDSRS
jgi:2,4-dienoyl-CoA reductase-like NADH-dependent reductase (Old Yellow Enzyme family)